MDIQRNQEGFTLVELMVVVLIIGILVSIAIPVFNAASERAKLRTCHANQRTIEGAAQQYIANVGPLWSLPHRLNGNGTPDTADLLVPQYIKLAPKCPRSGLYFYVTEDGEVTGDIGAAGWTPGHSHY